MGEQRSIKDHDAASVLLAERDRQREIAEDWRKLHAELARERASRQDWAAEATRLSWINEVHGSCVLSDELHPRVCACISDEHAAQLGPAFSRPVCAVHPEVRP